jgi:phage terminase large subunit
VETNNVPVSWIPIYNPLFELGKWRNKVYYGGRGGAKSESFGRALLSLGQKYKINILCTREVQNSIADSVHKLLKRLIDMYHLNNEYVVTDKNIVNKYTGTTFIFKGLRGQTVDSLKSTDGIDICWVEEAHSVCQKSWDVLIPTIRAFGSEIWVSFNPDYDDDPAYEMFVTNKQDDTLSIKVGWQDNPHLPDVLKKEKDKLYAINESKARNVWGGECNSNFEANVYHTFNEDTNCVNYELEYDETVPMWTGWDFGVSDGTAIFFIQVHNVVKSEEFPLGLKIEIIDEVFNVNEDYKYYRNIVDNKPYKIDIHACDSAGKNRESSKESWITNLAKNPNTGAKDWHFKFDTYHAGKITEMIDNANLYVHAVRYNKHQCPVAHKMFRRWQYRTDKNGKLILPLKPLHNEFSHPGTAFYFFTTNRFPIMPSGVYLP